eukprot:15455161-Alexandrium_andersonii.AAC.1
MDTDAVVDITQQSDMGLAFATFDYDAEQMLCAHRDRHDPGLVLSFALRQRDRVHELMELIATWPNG